MPRPALILALVAAVPWVPLRAAEVDPHLDIQLLPRDCASCHESHGEPGSPMLPETQMKVCLSCHDTQADVDRQIREGRLSSLARPPLLSQALAESFTHPLTETAFSRREPGVVTCSSCHFPHRNGSRRDRSAVPGRRPSTRSPLRAEVELCQSCHHREATRSAEPDVGVRMDPRNPSYHPVEAVSATTSPSLRDGLAGRSINCTDCHGSDDATTARGPHGSAIRFVLRDAYSAFDGEQESLETYSLCYRCHQREKVLASPLFPEHDRHVVELQVSCATCHDAHGSIENRALIRFGDSRVVAGVSPSASLDVLAFDSTMPGSGSCYLSCHGYDHAPANYGGGGFEVLGTRGDSPRQHRVEGLRQPRTGRSGRSDNPPRP